MHLQSIKIRGFKSFVDPIELKLEPGVAVVVGPNGSGKSNVADAIVWAAGSLTPSELRAEKPDDVLFGGAANRPAADHCEVELVFDNEDGGFGDEVDFSEIAITRRLVRGGEGQYLVNKAAVRRTDLVELLADVGLGGSMHSIVSQGKVDAVLASKPEDRRHLVEEAAGLGKFKRRKHRAELKLARVGIQVERAKDVEEEVRKRLRPLALQATAAERAEKLAIEIAALAGADRPARPARRDRSPRRRRGSPRRRRDRASQHAGAAHRPARGAPAGRGRAVGRGRRARDARSAPSTGSREPRERLVLRRESAAELEQRLRGDLAEAERAAADRSDETRPRRSRMQPAPRPTTARDAAEAHGQAAERARHAHARVAVHERRLAAEAQSRLAELRAERGGVEAALAGATGGQEGANRRLVALGAARERLGAAAGVGGNARRDAARRARGGARDRAPRRPRRPAELEARANEATAAARAAATERDDVAERSRSVKERLQALESAIAEREGIPPAASALAAAGETLALSALEAEPGAERAVAAALAWRASAVLARDAKRGLELLERTRKDGLGSLTVIVDRDAAAASSPPVAGARPLRELAAGDPAALRLLDGFWLVPAAQLLDAGHGTVITTEGHGYDAERGELWFAGETAEAVLLEMDARRRALADEADELTAARPRRRMPPPRRPRRPARPRRRSRRSPICASATSIRSCSARSSRSPTTARERARACRARRRRGSRSRSRRGSRSAPSRPASSEQSCAASRRSRPMPRARRRTPWRGRRRPRSSSPGSAAASTTLPPDGCGVARAARRGGDVAARARRGSRRRGRAAADRARDADAALLERAPRRSALDPDMLARLLDAVAGWAPGSTRARQLAARLEAPVRARVDAGAERSARLGEELRRLGAAEVEVRRGPTRRPSARPRSRSSSRGSTPRPRRRSAGSTRPAPTSRPRATTATSSRRGPSGSSAAARRSAR